MQRVSDPSQLFSSRAGVSLATMSVFELTCELSKRGFVKSTNVKQSRRINPFKTVDNGPKVWYIKEGWRPYKEYLLALLTASDRGLETIYHAQCRSYYKCLFLKSDLLPHQPAQFYKALMRRLKRRQNKSGVDGNGVDDVDDDDEQEIDGAAAAKVKAMPIKAMAELEDVIDFDEIGKPPAPAPQSKPQRKRKPVQKPRLMDVENDKHSASANESQGSLCDEEIDNDESDSDSMDSECRSDSLSEAVCGGEYSPSTAPPVDAQDQDPVPVHIIDSDDDDTPTRPSSSNTKTNNECVAGAGARPHTDDGVSGLRQPVTEEAAAKAGSIVQDIETDKGDGDGDGDATMVADDDAAAADLKSRDRAKSPDPAVATGSAVASLESEPIFAPRVNSDGHRKICSILLPDSCLQWELRHWLKL